METLKESQYQDCFTFYPNIMSLIDFKYIPGATPDDEGIFNYKNDEVDRLITNIKALAEKLGPEPVEMVEGRAQAPEPERRVSEIGGGGRKRSHKKIPYGLISSKKKQKKNSLKNNYQNSIIKTKKI